MDLKLHSKQISMLTEIFCMMPTIENLLILQRATNNMHTECEELKTEHPDYKG